MDFFSSLFPQIAINDFIMRIGNNDVFTTRITDDLLSQLDSLDFDSLINRNDRVRTIDNAFHPTRIVHGETIDRFGPNYSICASSVERYSIFLQDVINALKRELGYGGTITINLYLSGPDLGFQSHIDPRIVTAVQISGEKEWTYCPEPLETNPQVKPYNDTDRQEILSKHCSKYGLRTMTLRPGSLLCLAPGIIHSTKTLNNSTSLNIAFDYLNETLADYLSLSIKTILHGNPALRGPLFQQNFDHLMGVAAIELDRSLSSGILSAMVRRKIDD